MASRIRMFGIACKRYSDSQPTRTNPYGAFVWKSQYTPVFGWMHMACLGLKWQERTTRNPVSMDWLFSAPSEHRVWFIRGLSDSDGGVNFKDKVVDITTSPNTEFVKSLFDSLMVPANVWFLRGYGTVTISGKDAARIKIFNPEVLSYRRRLLERLVNAKTFPRRWPSWLEAKVNNLIKQEPGTREICERILAVDNVYIKMNSANRKRRQILSK